MKTQALAAVLLLLASASRAQIGDLGPALGRVGLPTNVETPGAPAAKGVAVGEDGTPLTPEEQRTNFAYGDVTNRLKRTIIGRGRHKHAAPGLTVADRVDRGEIKYIVIHSAMGTCQGSISTMQHQHAASHFMVCADGDVTRLVDIKNITLHVKNKDVNDTSVGIETETGWDGDRERFTEADWDPDTKWRMYASLAWLIRAVADEAHVARDAQHVIGHYEADLGIPDAHTDPGPLFYSKVYPAFEQRFPGQNMTPQKFLMLLVDDDTPPAIQRVPSTDALRVIEKNQSGIKKVVLYNLNGPKPVLDRTWLAPAHGLPPAVLDLSIPTEAGLYRIEAYDLVGNLTAARFSVGSTADGTIRIQMLPSAGGGIGAGR